MLGKFSKLSPWGKFWTLWAGTGAVAEVIALVRHNPGDTLSEQMWAIRRNTDNQGFYTLFLFFLLWLVWHFWKEGSD